MMFVIIPMMTILHIWTLKMIMKDTACSYDMLVIISMMTKLIKDTAAAGPPLMSFVTRLFRNIFLFLCVKIMMVMMMWSGDSNDGNQWLITSSKNMIFIEIGYHRNDNNQNLPHLIVIGVSMILSKFCAPWKVIPSLFFDAMQRYHNFHKSNLDPMLHHIFWITSYFAKHLRFVPEPDVFVQIAKCICPSYKSISCTRFSESHHILQNTEAEYWKRYFWCSNFCQECICQTNLSFQQMDRCWEIKIWLRPWTLGQLLLVNWVSQRIISDFATNWGRLTQHKLD